MDPFVELELSFYEKTVWAGENDLLIAVPYYEGIPITGGTYTVTEELLKGYESVLELLPLQQGEAQGSIVLSTPPQPYGGSKKITVTFEKGEVHVSASAIYHVNNITGISLDKRYRQYAWPGHTRTLTAEVKHTGYGDIEGLLSKKPMQIQWSSDKPDLAIPQKSSTAHREQNILYAKPDGNPVVTPELSVCTITAYVPGNNWGANEPHSTTTTFRVVPFTVVPGGFPPYGSEYPYQEFVLARGNLLVENTFDGTKNNRVWKFEENQWNYHTGFDGDDSYSVQGKTKYISHFGYGTSGIAPGYEPHTITVNDGADPNADYQWSEWGRHFDEYGVGHETLTTGAWRTPVMSSSELGPSPNISDTRPAALYDPSSDSFIYGYMILPSNFKIPSGCQMNDYGPYAYSPSTYSLADDGTHMGYWGDMEEAGVAFFPASGIRKGTDFLKLTDFYAVYRYRDLIDITVWGEFKGTHGGIWGRYDNKSSYSQGDAWLGSSSWGLAVRLFHE